MTQYLKALAALPEGPGEIPNAHIDALKLSITLAPGDMNSSGL